MPMNWVCKTDSSCTVTGANAQNDAYVKLLEVNNKSGIKAKIRLQVQGNGDVKEKDIWVKQNADRSSYPTKGMLTEMDLKYWT